MDIPILFLSSFKFFSFYWIDSPISFRAQKEIIIRLETLKDEQAKSSVPPSAPPLLEGHTSEEITELPPAYEEVNKVWQDVKELLSIKEGL